jgi:hypothetical protein
LAASLLLYVRFAAMTAEARWTLTPALHQCMQFMLASHATLQIHFIDIAAIPALESTACCLTATTNRRSEGFQQ